MDIKIEFPISQKTIEKIVEPPLVPLGQAIGGIIQWVFQKPIEYGVVRKSYLDNLKNCVQEDLNKIPEENRTSENLGLTLKAFEDSKYQLSDELLIEFFSKLISNTVDGRKNIKPLYSSILKEMSHDDAILFKNIYDKKILFRTQITADSPFVKDDRFRVTSPFKIYLVKNDADFDLYRETEKLSEQFHDDVEKMNNTESFLFLLSKQLLEIDKNENWNAMIPAVERKSLEEDKPIRDWINRYKNMDYRKKVDFKTDVYHLSPLGMALANSILNKR